VIAHSNSVASSGGYRNSLRNLTNPNILVANSTGLQINILLIAPRTILGSYQGNHHMWSECFRLTATGHASLKEMNMLNPW
jgi:hypothetical protein